MGRRAVAFCKLKNTILKFLLYGWKKEALVDYALAKTLDFIIKML